MTVWYNWWAASGWYIIDAFQKRCIYILHQAAGAKTLFRSNLETRLLNITQKNFFSLFHRLSQNAEYLQWWTRSKSWTAPRCPLHNLFSAKWVNRLLAHSLLKWGQIFINSPEITLSPQNTVFHFGHSMIALLQNFQKKAFTPELCWWWKYFFLQQSFPTSKRILLVAEAFSPNHLV